MFLKVVNVFVVAPSLANVEVRIVFATAVTGRKV